MKASRLLKEINELIEAYGDMEVLVMHDGDGSVQRCDTPMAYEWADMGEQMNDLGIKSPTNSVLVFKWSF